MASFSIGFLGCKVSQTDAQALQGAPAARRAHRDRRVRRCGRRQHLLCHERRPREVASGRVARGPVARARLRHRLRGAAVGDGFCRAPGERHRRRGPDRGGGRDRRRRRRRDRLCPGGRSARADPRLRQDPGRLLLLVLVLRDPARARGDPEPQRCGRARRDPPPRRAGASRGRAHRGQPRLLSRPGCGLHPRAPDPRGRRGRGRRAAATLVDRDQPRDGRPDCGTPRDAGRRAAPARAAPVGRRRRAARDAQALHGRQVPAHGRAAHGLQPDGRRDRRVPGRGRGRVRADGRDGTHGPAHQAPCVPVLAQAGHSHGCRTTRSRLR